MHSSVSRAYETHWRWRFDPDQKRRVLRRVPRLLDQNWPSWRQFQVVLSLVTFIAQVPGQLNVESPI